MSSVRVKICGITRLEDALAAAELGADALGFNFWPGSKRHVDPETAQAIVGRLPPFVTPVGVFVNQEPTEVLHLCALSRVTVVQLHGDEEPRDCAGHVMPVIKAFRVSGPADLAPIPRYHRAAAILLDAPGDGYGGSGQTFDWALARQATGGKPILLAGGLTPDNVAAAVRAVRPWAVDVASGVESAPGIKDHDKLARFIRAAKES
ncbi:MAG: phosphoribosylanthranilate isomerase [Deltaproteobacteria bacterium]|nr:phosphoribosylanthranilate isomerase [Deltaproteobacteria bacterium]